MKIKSIAVLAASALLCAAPAAAYAADLQPMAGSSEVTVSSVADLKDAVAHTGSYSDLSGTVTIKLAKGGTYELSSTLKVSEGATTLDLNGQTMTCSADYGISITGSNVSVVNGTLSGTGVRVNSSDAQGEIRGLTIKNAPDYGVYVQDTIGSISDCTITKPGSIGINVQGGTVAGDISGNTITESQSTGHGSINLINSAKVKGKIANNTIRDGKAFGIRGFSKSSCGNIERNTITGCADHAIQLTGSSTTKTNDGCTAGDIAYNTIKDCKGHGISLYHGTQVGKITYNTLDTIGGKNSGGIGDYGITVNSGTPYTCSAKEITHNTLKNVTYAGIVVFSGPEGDTTGKWQDNGRVTGDIAYNTVTNSSSYKKGVNWRNTKLACQGAIYVDSHAWVKGSIHHNTINTPYDDGINILAYSHVKSIYNNKVKNAKYAGIAVVNSAVVEEGIYSNKVTSPSYYGLFVNNAGKVKGKVRKNTFASAGQNGVFVGKSSTVATLTNNKITNAGLYGLITSAKSKITTLSNNTISTSNAKNGIVLISNTGTYIKNIKGNTLTGKYRSGLVVKSPTGKVTIASNTITSGNAKGVKSMGISVSGCKKGVTITGNKITGNNTGGGIYVKSSKASISKNTVKKSTKKIIK